MKAIGFEVSPLRSATFGGLVKELGFEVSPPPVRHLRFHPKRVPLSTWVIPPKIADQMSGIFS